MGEGAGVAHPVALGSRNAPGIADVRALVARVTAPLRTERHGRRCAVVDLHNALTMHTVLFGMFVTGGRPTSMLLLDPDRIDRATGFAIVDDKPTRDNLKSRLVWVSEAYRTQLALYRDHLTAVARRRSPTP